MEAPVKPKTGARVRIRPLVRFSEFEECVTIQKEVWKHDDLDVTPVHQFCIAVKTGGILLGAFLEGVMAGFVYSFPSVFQGRLCHHSHLLAVRPQFQGLGIGKKLKWAQRAEALRQGISLITWTVDPLQAKNANLNIHTLGAITRTYWDNFYGYTSALMLGPNIPTDRFLMEWMLGSKRVVEREKKPPEVAYPVDKLPKAVESQPGPSGLLEVAKERLTLTKGIILVELLRDVRSYSDQPEIIGRWQAAIRKALKSYFRRGYVVSDFIFGERCFYVLERIDRLKDLKAAKKRR